MALQLTLFEDKHYRQFFPISMLRPVYLLRPGILPQWKKAKQHFPNTKLSFLCRTQIAPVLAETVPDVPVNIIKRERDDLLLLNGRIRNWGDLPAKIKESEYTRAWTAEGEVAAVLLKSGSLGELPPIAESQAIIDYVQDQNESIPRHTTDATLYSHLWEFVDDIETAIEADYRLIEPGFGPPSGLKVHDGAFFVNENDVFLGDDTEVLPGAVIDASHGPVCIGNSVRVEPHAALMGPCFVGSNSVVLAGKVTGSSIGHTSRVGGEIEESIFQSYVNKYHAGFIGHSYVGQWVNFGAMTTNSDLKNNYSSMRVSVNGEMVDSGSIKVGSFIGDHTKFGIGTMLNTGISIGVCCNIFGGSLVVDKEVPSFRWGGTDNWTDYKFNKAIETASRTTERRHVTLSDRETALLKLVAESALSDEGILDLDD